MLHRIAISFMIPCLLFSATWAQGQQAIPVEATVVKTDTITTEVTAVGTLRAREGVIIRSEIPGRILRLNFSETQPVEKGRPLIILDSAEYEAQLAESTAEVKLDKLNFERVKNMFSKKLVSRQEFDEARAKLDRSLAHQALDKARLEKTVLYAPFRGIVGLRNISEGAYVQDGQDLILFGDRSTVKLDFRVPEKFLPQLQLGQTVTMQVDAYPNKVFTGKVYASDIIIDEETRTILLRARVANPKGELFSGMFARVKLVLEKRENAMVIPEQAIVPQGQASFVFKVVTDRAMLTEVVLGQRRTGEIEILKGLQPGDKIVTSGQIKLYDGAEVMVIEESELPPEKN